MGRRTVIYLCLTWLLAGCSEEPATPLSELAAPPSETSVPATASPLTLPAATVSIRHPGRFVAIVRPLLGLADDVESAALVAGELERFSGLYCEVTELSLSFDEEAGEPALAALSAFLVLRPAAGSKAADLAAWWGPRLALLPPWPGGEETFCAHRNGLLLCGPGEASPPDGFLERARVALDGTTAVLSVTLDFPRLLTVLEGLVTVPLLWAVVPEEARRFSSLSLVLSEDPDRLAVDLVTTESGLAEAFVRVFEPVSRPILVPRSAPVVAFTAVRDLKDRLEKVQDFWDNKIPLSKDQQLQTLLNDSWQSQMLELANGLAGVVLVGEVPLTGLDPAAPLKTPGLVYFIQVSDGEAMEARLKHVFNTKYFRLEDENLDDQTKITHAFWKKKKKKGKRERLSWFIEEDSWTYFFGLSDILTRFVSERKAAQEAGTAMKLTLAPGEAARFTLAPGGLVARLTASQKGGISAAMALGMVKNSLGAVGGEIVVRIHHVAAQDGGHIASFEVLGLLGTVKDAVTRSENLLKMLPAVQ